MKSEKGAEMFVYKLLQVMPDWHSRLVRPFKEKLNGEMSLETYYCLQTLRMRGLATMTELAHELKVPKQQVTKLVDKLCECEFCGTGAACGGSQIRLYPSDAQSGNLSGFLLHKKQGLHRKPGRTADGRRYHETEPGRRDTE